MVSPIFFDKESFRKTFTDMLWTTFSVTPEKCTEEQCYEALARLLRDAFKKSRAEYMAGVHRTQQKQVYYLSMEFLMGRSLKNALYNWNLTELVEQVLLEYGISLHRVYEKEPDAGLGNGGLGRLAACFLDALATASIPAMGYSLLYECGIFRQKIVDGKQQETPDFWLPGGECWLVPRPEHAKEVWFGGTLQESWDGGFHRTEHQNATVVVAKPYDMLVPGKDGAGVSVLRLWKATSPSGMDMSLFNCGEYARAMEKKSLAEVITQVLYPADEHCEGKRLRLTQQYFLVSASAQDIVTRHLEHYGTPDSLPEKAAVHINDTHPTLIIPELMRLFLDECGYTWEKAWSLVCRMVAYTNHTVMREALECWPEELFSKQLPRIYQIVKEIDRRYTWELSQKAGEHSHMAILQNGTIHMANLCIAAAHSVNGVAKIHSQILKESVFREAYTLTPEKFKNVTNGIAHRRWLCQANPLLSAWITERIGNDYVLDATALSRLEKFSNDAAAKEEFLAIKQHNKERLAHYIAKKNGVAVDPRSIFDVQVKRLHEYKRQHLNALHILHRYLEIKENPTADVTPRTYIFGAKAAPSYAMAKEIIHLLCTISKLIENDAAVREKLRVVYLEDYRVTLAELLMPAADISEQISLAGTEASGTGNMKLMMNGAITLGTLDGANVEICEQVGKENMFLFGMEKHEVEQKRNGYEPRRVAETDKRLQRVFQLLEKGIEGVRFTTLAQSLLQHDPYMVLADFDAYCAAQERSAQTYRDRSCWGRMALINTAKSGVFSADRSVRDYAKTIWQIP